MEAIKRKNFEKLFTVLTGALLMGMLWRVRGTGGWGSSWGLLNAGFIFCMFIALVMGERKKTGYGWIALCALSFMLTTPSWGTLLTQITGVLYKFEFWTEGDPMVYVSIPSALFLMVCLGFGLASIFGIMLGRGYSEKQWKIKDFVIILVVFYGVDILTKATISHYILDLVQPEAGEIFSVGLKNAGIDLTPHQAFLEHFNDLAWSKKFDGGRNYFSSIQAISSLFKSLAVILAARFIVKDKVAAKISGIVCCAFGFSITVSDLFFYFGNGGYHQLGTSPFSEAIAPWSCWEYFTGFIAGGIITFAILKLKPAKDVDELAFSKVAEKPKNILTFIIFFLALMGISVVRPVLERLDESDFQIIATVLAVLAFVGIITKKFGFNAKNITSTRLYGILLPCFIVFIMIAYMFIAIPDEQNFRNISQLHNVLTTLSALSVLGWCLAKKKKLG